MARAKINADKPHLWKADIAGSVDQVNQWFLRFAPETFRTTRVKTTEHVKAARLATNDLRNLNAETLRTSPGALPTLRMCTAPPLAVDRLIGLARANKSLIGSMEEGRLSSRMKPELLAEHLNSVCRVLSRLLDRDIFPWLEAGTSPSDHERERASTIVAHRLCSARSSGDIREARRTHQITVAAAFLDSVGYHEEKPTDGHGFTTTEPGAYSIDVAVPLAMGRNWLMAADLLVQPLDCRPRRFPLLIDFASPVDRRADAQGVSKAVQKQRTIHMTYGDSVSYVLMLGGIHDAGSLGVLAAEGIDWVWQHRVAELAKLITSRLPVSQNLMLQLG